MDYEEYKRKALEPIVNYIESVMASYSKEELEARIKKALQEKESESEDERVRKALLRCCDDWEKGQFGCMAKEYIPAIRAYLEKQKEQKPVEIHIDNPNIQKFDPDVKVTTSNSSADGKELLYVSNKSYDIGFRDGVASVKPAEWSEEDERMLSRCIKSIECSKMFAETDTFKEAKDKEIDWLTKRLKSLRPQPHWKPSEEQMRCLLVCVSKAKEIS